MSYQVLARTWRPRTFAEVAGQGHAIKVLSHALESGRLHHAYLFSGTRGVGKTTLARVLARCMNCEQGVSPTPCGECGACREIDAGCFPDLIEVDAASRAKVEETRELMNNVQYMPVSGRFKVYLIDEVHMFSNHSFNALLKTLEEPPPYVKFLLATTEPRKVPVTVLSRCLQLNLRHLSVDQIMAQLRTIVEAESVTFDAGCLRLLASAARGSMRDALSLLDQAISHGSGALQETQIRRMLGTVAYDNLTALAEALLRADGPLLLRALQELADFGPDYFMVLMELQTLLQKAAMVQLVPEHAETLAGHDPLVRRLAEGLDRETVQLYYQLCLKGQQDLAIAPDLACGFEMVMVRLLAFRPLPSDAEQDDTRRAAAREAPASGKSPVSSKSWVPGRSPTSGRSSVSGGSPTSGGSPISGGSSASGRSSVSGRSPASGKSPASDKSPVSGRSPVSGKSPASGKSSASDRSPDTPGVEDGIARWAALVQKLGLRGLTRELANHCLPGEWTEQSLELLIRPSHASWLDGRAEQSLRRALQVHLGESAQLRFTVARQLPGETLAQREQQEQQEQQRRSREDFREDTTVRSLVDLFDGRIDDESSTMGE